MKKAIIIAMVCLIAYLVFVYPKSRYNTRNIDGFNVSNAYSNSASLEVMQSLYGRCRNVLEFINREYVSGTREFNEPGFTKLQLQAGVHRALDNFVPSNLYEILPNNVFGDTAYTENKKTMMMCIRKSDGSVYDLNTMMFVTLHEISHIINDEWDHGLRFWRIFRFVLGCARECGETCGGYDPVDYSKSNVNYCGLNITLNPLYVPNTM